MYLCSGLCLNEVVLHETLEVKIGELIVVLDLEKSSELGIRDDLATIILILELVGTDVGIDLLAHFSAGHLSSGRLSEESCELITDAGRLNESRWLAVTGTLGFLGRSLGCGLELASNRLLKRLEITLE